MRDSIKNYVLVLFCILRACFYDYPVDTFSWESRLSQRSRRPLAHTPIGRWFRSRLLLHRARKGRLSFWEDNTCRCTVPRRPPSKDSARNAAPPRSRVERRNSRADRDLVCRPRGRNRSMGSTRIVVCNRISRRPSHCHPDKEACSSDSCLVSTREYVPLSPARKRVCKEKCIAHISWSRDLFFFILTLLITVELPPLTWDVSSSTGNARSWPGII